MIGTVISGILLALIGKYLGDIPQEFFYVLFWLFADAFVRYIFIESVDYRGKRIGAGRIASIKVEFVEDVKEMKIRLIKIDNKTIRSLVPVVMFF